MKLNKKTRTQEILAIGSQRRCIKLELRNIVYPKWSDMGLDGLIFRQCLKTKAQPTGNIYDEAVFQTVLRIIGGKVLISVVLTVTAGNSINWKKPRTFALSAQTPLWV